MVRLSAGRAEMSEELQALCFLAGANSIFYGEKLLTTGNPDVEADRALFARLGLRADAGAGAGSGRAHRARRRARADAADAARPSPAPPDDAAHPPRRSRHGRARRARRRRDAARRAA